MSIETVDTDTPRVSRTSRKSSVMVIDSKMSVWARAARIWQYRELLMGMVRKELKVKYKNSILGFLWSMLNPAFMLAIFYVVFVIVLKSGIPVFPIYLLSGLLVWNLFSTALPAATGSIVGNASIVKKVSFPREVLPLSTVGAALVHFFLQGIVLIGAMVLLSYHAALSWLPLLIPALIALLIFTSAMAVFLSAVNVYLRDTQHFLELALLAWFWGTPVVYQYQLVLRGLKGNMWLYFLNPLTSIVLVFQRVLYNKISPKGVGILPVGKSEWWYLSHVLVVMGVSVVLFFLALMIFGRLEGNFAEEL